MQQGVDEAKSNPSIRLVDVRTPQEYREGHVPGSVNVPLDRLQDLPTHIPDKGTKLYLYCASGSRSAMATTAAGRMGYADVTNIGGINGYRGDVAVGA